MGVDCLQDGADVEDNRCKYDGPSTAEAGGEWPDEEAREECYILSVMTKNRNTCVRREVRTSSLQQTR